MEEGDCAEEEGRCVCTEVSHHSNNVTIPLHIVQYSTG